MKYSILAVVASLAMGAAQPVSSNEKMVANALAWGLIWDGIPTVSAEDQLCRGVSEGSQIKFRCDPVAMAVTIDVPETGRCRISWVAAGVPVEYEPKILKLHVPAGLRIPSPPKEFTGLRTALRCGEIPQHEGSIRFNVKPERGQESKALTQRAYQQVREYLVRGGAHEIMGDCRFRVPKTSSGDPFFHVYAVCGGKLSFIQEFQIHDDEPAGHPHWSYRLKDVPPGTPDRLRNEELWFGTVQP